MMPDFAGLLQDVYPGLQTSDRVTAPGARLSPPPGVVHSMWWWDCGGGAGEVMEPKP